MELFVDVAAPGDSPPVVLLHSLALDHSMWHPLVCALSGEARRLITPDLRGHGGSSGSGEFTIEDMADDVVVTLAAMGHDEAVLVGLSMGGCVAQAVATRYPELVLGLGLIDTTAWYGEDARERWAERADLARTRGMTSLSSFQLDRWFSAGFAEAHPEVCRDLLKVFEANEVESYAAACRAMGAFDGRESLESIRVPTVIVVGEFDQATPPAYAAEIHALVRSSVMHVIPGGKHLTPVDHPAIVADLLRPLWAG